MTALQALLWDVDGTLAETERDGHRVAFNQAFEAHGLPWRWDEAQYGRLLDIAGGRERVLHFLSSCGDAPPLAAGREALAASLHGQKNAFYADLVRQDRLPLRIGPLQAVALEDSPGGVAAARAAGTPVVVTRSHCFADAVIEGAIAIGPGLHTRAGWRPALAGEGRVTLADIAQWHGQVERVSQSG